MSRPDKSRCYRDSIPALSTLEGVSKTPFFIVVSQTTENFKSKTFIQLEAIDIPLLKNFILTGLYTGMRLAEILNLQWRDIVLDEKVVKVLNKENHTTKTTMICSVPIS
ncbi:MAG: tyrosine-type recombinase/integrase [Ignavibacteriae bacterium]|nr:tyrosine-type recombinase/integrase [Ignavibacteriota bacterium]